MKINPLFQSDIVSRYMDNATCVSHKAEKTSATSSSSDSVELSNGAQKYAELLHTARSAIDQSDKDEEVRTGEIMAQYQAGTYQVSDNDVIAALTGGNIPDYC